MDIFIKEYLSINEKAVMLMVFSYFLLLTTYQFLDLYPHVFATDDSELKKGAVEVLQYFYEERFNYGPKVNISIINCMDQLNKVGLYLYFFYRFIEIDFS